MSVPAGCQPLCPQPRGIRVTSGSPGQEPLRVLSLQGNGAARAMLRWTAEDDHGRRNCRDWLQRP